MTAPRRHVLVPFGTRPEFVKLAPVVRALHDGGVFVTTVATGQHHDAQMADAFFSELRLEPGSRHTLEGDEADRLGQLVTNAERDVRQHAPDLVLLLGDTNTVPAYAIAARRRQVPVGHLEAGLRSFNPTSIEEVNRKVAASCASLQLAPTELARQFLLAEGVARETIHVVGNPVIDVLIEMGVEPLPARSRDRVLVTAHRATNVDDRGRLEAIVQLVRRLATEVGPVTFPVHPRTRDRLSAFGLAGELESEGIELLPPVPYKEMLALLASSRVVVTDSGGIQEEASYLGVPVVVLRRSTPRWEGVALGSSRLVGLDVEVALEAATAFSVPTVQARIAALPCPYGDGRTGQRVLELLTEDAVWESMRLVEPEGEAFAPALLRDAAAQLGERTSP